MGTPFPVDGRKLGIVVDEGSDMGSVAAMVEVARSSNLVPFVIAPRGGTIGDLVADRTYATARSFEYDALVLAGAAAPAADAVPSLDARGGDPASAGASADPRIPLIVGEVWRHCKVLGVLGDPAARVLAGAGVPSDGAGVVVEQDPAEMVASVVALLSLHRVWDRFVPQSA